MRQELRQSDNHRLVTKIEEKGALQRAKDGDLSVNQLPHAKNYEQIQNKFRTFLTDTGGMSVALFYIMSIEIQFM